MLLLLAAATHVASASTVQCKRIAIPSLVALLPYYRAARICIPPGPPAPLHLFAHADFGGGPMAVAYDRIMEQVASHGFAVAEYLSCAIDQECVNGEADFLELLETVAWLQRSPDWASRIDLKSNFSISGHSTGARAVLMLAALRDSPAYLLNTSLASRVTPAMRENVAKIAAVVSNHPDMMYDTYYNPDVANYKIDRTPVLILTGSNDTSIEKPGSAWRDFRLMSTPDKVFVDVAGAVHSEPVLGHRGGPFTAYFSQLYALQNESAAPLIFGDGPASIRGTLPIAPAGDPNTGDGRVGFLGCRSVGGTKAAVPPELLAYC